jgi:hypothetical protein
MAIASATVSGLRGTGSGIGSQGQGVLFIVRYSFVSSSNAITSNDKPPKGLALFKRFAKACAANHKAE